ncbi:MAG TPA: HAD hydrolase-like protein [Polyangia bacterium]|jgi:phosphoglycolate phosphatase|nr:HAD hydrolase-like protein [Polyangia bacterium]
MTSSFALAIFDLDGTLVDSLSDIAAALNRTREYAGLAPLPFAQIAGYFGDGAAKLLQRAWPEGTSPQILDDLGRHFLATYAQHLHDRTRLFPGLEPILRRLANSMPLAVLTNKRGDLARSLLAGLGLEHHFTDVIGDGDGFARKPDPAAGRWLLQRHGVDDPRRALVVGDGLPDLRFARALGAPSAAVAWGYVARDLLAAEQPTWLADAPETLLEIAGIASDA